MTLNFAPQTAFIFMLIFARVGTMLMVLPAFGERGVTSRQRLALALVLTLVLYPLISGELETLPEGIFQAMRLVAIEIGTGLFIGASVRLVMSALQVAGTVIAMQTGLGFAQNVDPAQGVQSALFASFMSLTAITLIFVMDLHHLLLAAIVDSYTIFKPGALVPVGDFAKMALSTVSASFVVAVQMSAPFLVFGLVFYMGVGVLSRLMPQAQIFFVALPVNILAGFVLFMFLMTAIMGWFLGHFESALAPYLN